MANVKTQGTQAYAVIDGQVYRFVCVKKNWIRSRLIWEN